MNTILEFILSKRYCYICSCCDHCIEKRIMQHSFRYNDINDNDIWNRMLELSRDNNNNNNNNNNNINNQHNNINNQDNNNNNNNIIYVNNYVYFNRNEENNCEFNLSIDIQRSFLLNDFKNKYL